MAGIAIGILWFLIGLIILCGIVYLAIWVIEQFVTAIPEKIKQGIWVIILLLALIYLIGILTGAGPTVHPFRLSGVTGGTTTTYTASAPTDMQRMLT